MLTDHDRALRIDATLAELELLTTKLEHVDQIAARLRLAVHQRIVELENYLAHVERQRDGEQWEH